MNFETEILTLKTESPDKWELIEVIIDDVFYYKDWDSGERDDSSYLTLYNQYNKLKLKDKDTLNGHLERLDFLWENDNYWITRAVPEIFIDYYNLLKELIKKEYQEHY